MIVQSPFHPPADVDEIVITVAWGGLGDHLFLSHIPRVAKSLGVPKVTMNRERSAWRSKEYESIWTGNPHFDGWTNKPGTHEAFWNGCGFPDTNILDVLMWNLGMDDGLRFHQPEFYHPRQPRTDLADCVVFDPNYVSNSRDVDPDKIQAYLRENGITVDAEMAPRGEAKVGATSNYSLGTKRLLGPCSLNEYADIILGCKQFLCILSGGASLAAALGKPSVVFCPPSQGTMYHHYPSHRYIMC